MKKIIATIVLLTAAVQGENIVHYGKTSFEQVVFKPYHPTLENIIPDSKGQMDEKTFKPYHPTLDSLIQPIQ
ncbi:MAG: hypothetical protein Q7T91_09710 [Sulfuricurvum sp.]|nr:hypothetical protein [Sulfuricurvum sp.]